ncbi:rod shape-determining protein RodA [Candidatus Nomurabacteria bacterium]|nr:rod shape-determining protein RodA [Candidatus Nomurabacteria bacterium]
MPRFDFKHIDWLLVAFVLPIIFAGLVTMRSFVGDTPFFKQQLIWTCISFVVFLFISFLDFRFLKKTKFIILLYIFFLVILTMLFVFGSTVKGATSWFDLGSFSFQPVDFVKIVLIIVLAKYFSRRHVEIKDPRHVFVSALYAAIPFFLVFLQPDFGSALIIFIIWFGMTLISGISKKHLATVFLIGMTAFAGLWIFVFEDYQKNRIETFLHPLSDIRGVGYNAYQSTVAVGSGQMFGKGVGYGTQSRLQFLPEFQTDFIFAAFSEEWGFVGSATVILLYVLVIWRILKTAMYGSTNFEVLFGVGVAVMIMSHTIINIGMNIGLMPVTGITLPFMSYGGSNLLMLFISLGILMGMRKYRREIHREDMNQEFLGI